LAIHTKQLQVATHGKGLYPFTGEVAKWLCSLGVSDGPLTVFIQHTSASLVVQENADPDVVLDLAEFFDRLVPEGERWYRHTLEGPDDMTSHIRSSLTQASLTIPVIAGQMALGKWQGLYVFEHRREEHVRSVILQLMTASPAPPNAR
jgi:secondary thiamine-phosphate synthase enzyme